MTSPNNDPVNRTQAPGQVGNQGATVQPNTLRDQVIVSSAPREGFLTGSFVWMFVGVLLSAIAAYFVDADDVRMIQLSSRPGFA